MISTQITHASTPTQTQFNFNMTTKIGTLDEKSINRYYELVSSLMVALSTEQASLIQYNHKESLREGRVCMVKDKTQGIREASHAQQLPTLELI